MTGGWFRRPQPDMSPPGMPPIDMPPTGTEQDATFAAMSSRWDELWQLAAPAMFWTDDTPVADSGGGYRCPTLLQFVDCPDVDTPTYRVLSFAMSAGTRFADVAKLGRRLRDCLSCELAAVEHCQQRPGCADVLEFTVSHNVAALGARPHLNLALDDDTARFAARSSAVEAFRTAQLGTPIALAQTQLCRAGPVVLWTTSWALTGDVAARKACDTAHTLGALLRCDVSLMFEQGAGQVCYLFGTLNSGDSFAGHLKNVDSGWVGQLSGRDTDIAQLRNLLTG